MCVCVCVCVMVVKDVSVHGSGEKTRCVTSSSDTNFTLKAQPVHFRASLLKLQQTQQLAQRLYALSRLDEHREPITFDLPNVLCDWSSHLIGCQSCDQ